MKQCVGVISNKWMSVTSTPSPSQSVVSCHVTLQCRHLLANCWHGKL